MKVLITGGAGFIGSHVVDACVEQGHDVLCIDSLDPGVHHGAPEYLRRDVDYCFADLRYWAPDSRFSDVEAVVHLAALGGVTRASREPSNIIDANCRGTARLAEFARNWPKLQRIVLAGSFSVYGSNYRYRCPGCGHQTDARRLETDLLAGEFDVLCPRCRSEAEVIPITEDSVPAPLETYGVSKYMQELCFRGFNAAPVQILRFSSVYGDRLRLDDGEATIIARLAGWIQNGERPRLYEDGRQMRDWVYVGDVVAAVLRLLGGATAPPIVNVCSGIPTSLTSACDAIARACGVECVPEIVGGYRAGDMRHCLGNPANLIHLIGREPVPFSEGAALAFSPMPRQGRDLCAEFSSPTV